MNRWEKLVVNSPFRAFYLKYLCLPYLLQEIPLPPTPSCLEIGCGIGAGAATLHRRLACRQFLALDYDPKQIHSAQRRFGHLPGLSFILGSADKLPMKDCSVDAVFDLGILHHVEHWRQAIEEVYRVLKPGGVFLFEDILRPLVNILFLLQFEHPEKGKFYDYELIDTLEHTGFTLIKRAQIARHYIVGIAQKPA